MSAERIVAYFHINGKDVEIHGTILTKLSDKSDLVYYEIHTDKHVHFLVRDKEVKLKAYRTTTLENSLFVRTDQCVQEDPDHQNLSAPPLPPNHPTAYNGAVTNTERKTTFILGDLITLPLEGGTNKLINGTVGYSGIYKNREVVELCADTKENTSAFICSIRNKYESPNFPDRLRHHDMKGFSLVVDANTVIPHHGDNSAPPPPHRTDSFSQPVSSRRNPDTSHGYPRKLTKTMDVRVTLETAFNNEDTCMQTVLHVNLFANSILLDNRFDCVTFELTLSKTYTSSKIYLFIFILFDNMEIL